jgi:hypothetical protein
MAEVTRQDIEETVLATDFDFDQFVSLITKHVEIQIPNELNNPNKKEELVDFVFNAIQKQDQENDTENEAVVAAEEVAAAVEEDKEELKIKIDLNLGSEQESPETSSADEGILITPLDEPKMEVEQEIEGTTQKVDSISIDMESGGVDAMSASPDSASVSTPPFADRKSHIIALVKESKWTIRQVVQIIDDKWGYAAQGKSSKTRVSKTIRDLRDNNMLYEESNGILMWRGE